jgi:hypothetical protein
MISLMDKGRKMGANCDEVMLSDSHEKKFSLLFRHCRYGLLESTSKSVPGTQGRMSRLHLQHAAFNGRLLQV